MPPRDTFRGQPALPACDNPAEILGFSLDDGSLQATHAFDAGVCNDLAMDGEGNLYATETFGSRIMRVQAGDLLSNTDAEEWDADNLYAVAQGELGLNGIASDGDSVLYTVNTARRDVPHRNPAKRQRRRPHGGRSRRNHPARTRWRRA